MIVHVLKEMLMYAQPVSMKKTPSTNRQHVDETPDIIQPELKRPRTEVSGSFIERNHGSIIKKSKKSIKHASKNYYRWNSEHLITFSWLHYDVAEQEASCRFTGSKMYHSQFSHLTWQSGGISSL